MRNWIATVGLMLVTLASAQNAVAASDSTQIKVSVQVVPNCRVLVTDLAFGTYDPLMQHSSQPLDGTAVVTVLCTKDLRATLLMGDDGAPARAMRSDMGALSYSLYSDSSHTRIWGTGANAMTIIGTGSTPQTMTVYGRVPSAQVVPAGWYTDSVTATVDF